MNIEKSDYLIGWRCDLQYHSCPIVQPPMVIHTARTDLDFHDQEQMKAEFWECLIRFFVCLVLASYEKQLYCYLPNQTPDGLVELRKEELIRLRGDGTGERKEWDRIYDYDYYNDLGNPDKGLEYIRPILGGSQLYPYPRRLRTGRPSSNHDFRTESRPESFNIDIYAPPDERFSPKKQSELISNAIQAAMCLVIPEAKAMFKEGSSHFESFNEIAQLFTSTRDQGEEECVVKNLKRAVPDDFLKKIKQVIKKNPVKFPLPEIIAGNKFVWMDDDEFGRQMLAGINPTVIQCLQRFPPKSRNGVKSSIKQSDIDRT
ncbi:Linoleate 9S-lipoxygenase 1 [Abeliophyllum distichum]|uniref:Linoleate 9S-lipoxygenase 1 n=1 Tax=Abeliophyllum distichum TaxID=126358 RepID=A0ABD1Q4G2_9LAMI